MSLPADFNASTHPEVTPPFQVLLELQDRMAKAFSKRDGIAWRLGQIQDRAKAREGEDREKLLRRAEVLEQEYRTAIVEAEKIRAEVIEQEINLHLEQIGALVQNGSDKVQQVYASYVEAMKAIPRTQIDPAVLADRMLVSIRLNRQRVMNGELEPSAESIAAEKAVQDLWTAFEEERQRRMAVAAEHEPKIRRLLQPVKASRKR